MTAEGHLLFSVASVVMVHQLQISPDISQGDWLHLIPGALAGALLPDIDHPKSMLVSGFALFQCQSPACAATGVSPTVCWQF